MFMLFFILLIISVIAIIIGMVKPDLVLRFMDKEKRTRNNVLRVFVVIGIVSFVLMIFTSPDIEDEPVAENEEIEEEEQEEEEVELELSSEEKELLTKGYAGLSSDEQKTVDLVIKNMDEYTKEDKDFITDNKERIEGQKATLEKKREEKRKAEAEKEAKEKEEQEAKEKIDREEREAKEEEERVAQEKIDAEAKAKQDKLDNATLGEENALQTGKDYLDYSSFSRSGLIKQLEFEGYSNAEANFAVDNMTVDWNDQALQTGKDYLDYSSFSRSGLIKQLEFEGYSLEQATYAVNEIGL